MSSQYWLSDTRPSSPLRINTEIGGALSANQREVTVEVDARRNTSVLSPTRRYDSPISRVRCDGWCGYDLIPRAKVVGGDSPASCGQMTLMISLWASHQPDIVVRVRRPTTCMGGASGITDGCIMRIP